MRCKYCKNLCSKAGRQSNGRQKYRCRKCFKYQQRRYHPYPSNNEVTRLLVEGCSIRSISRLLDISATTVLRRILALSLKLKKPTMVIGKEYELDEMCTFIGSKDNRTWIAYAIRKDTKEVVDFRVGNRSKKLLRPITEGLILSKSKKVFTDKLIHYKGLIPSDIHNTVKYGTNHIERMNLTLRTHLKRLNRRSICYSKSLLILIACLKIYFWSAELC